MELHHALGQRVPSPKRNNKGRARGRPISVAVGLLRIQRCRVSSSLKFTSVCFHGKYGNHQEELHLGHRPWWGGVVLVPSVGFTSGIKINCDTEMDPSQKSSKEKHPLNLTCNYLPRLLRTFSTSHGFNISVLLLLCGFTCVTVLITLVFKVNLFLAECHLCWINVKSTESKCCPSSSNQFSVLLSSSSGLMQRL